MKDDEFQDGTGESTTTDHTATDRSTSTSDTQAPRDGRGSTDDAGSTDVVGSTDAAYSTDVVGSTDAEGSTDVVGSTDAAYSTDVVGSTDAADSTDGGGQSRRSILQSAGALGVGGLIGTGASTVGFGGTAAADSTEPWTVVAIPDTQNMISADSRTPAAESITDWVVENADARNVAFVTHEGDMVFDGSDIDQWERIDSVMSKLDGVVPWSPNVGNHDFTDTWDRSSGAANFEEYFGASRFQDRDYFGGASDNGRNFYQYFSAGGYEFLHISLEWEAPGDVADASTPLGWAKQVLDDHPDTPTILTTHSYLGDDPRERKRDVEAVDGWGTSGQEMWEELVSPNPQVFMVLNGHNHDLSDGDQGEHHQVSSNVLGEDVYEMLANFQDYPNGGNGWFRRIRFVPGGGTDAPDRIEVQTYSASLDEYQTSDRSEFGFDLDFDSRFSVSSESAERVTFQQGEDGYTGTVDTQLHEANASKEYSDVTTVTVDGSDDGGEVHGLLQFEDVVGAGAGQLPAGANVQSATLTVESTNPGDGATVHRMLRGWTDTDTWNDLGGVQADGSDAATSATATEENTDTGSITMDVTESVQAWSDGEANDGWAFLPLGTNGWDFETADGATPPRLAVVYENDDDSGGGGGGGETSDVSFVSASETASTDDQFRVDRPSSVTAGDVLLLTIGGTANNEDGMPYGQADRWTRIDICSQDNNGDEECVTDGQDLFIHMYYTVATANEPAAYDVASGGNSVASIAAFRGVDTDDPVVSSAGLVNDGDYQVSTCPSTDGVDGGMLVCGIAQDDQLYLEDHDDLTQRSVDANGDSTTTVLTESLVSDGATDRHEVDIVDPTGNKDTSLATVLRPGSADDGGPQEGVHVVDDTTARVVWKPDFDVTWNNYVYFGSAINGEPRQWQLMDETSENVFETTFGGLSAGDTIEYQFSYWANDAWQYTALTTESFDPGGPSGPGTSKLVHGEGDTLRPGEYLESSTGDYRLYFQASDGNLVLRDERTGDALWATMTNGDGGTRLPLQGDGNLVMYTDVGDAVWASDTAGSGADELVLEDDGALVLTDGETTIWSKNDA